MDPTRKVSVFQRVINALGWLAFVLVVPTVLAALGVTGPQEGIAQALGPAGAPSTLILAFFALLFLRIMFGGDRILLPLLIGYPVAFLLMSTAVQMRFMGWFVGFAAKVPFLVNTSVNFLVAVGLTILAILLSHLRKMNGLAQLLVLAALPVALVGVAHATGVPRLAPMPRLSVDEGIASLAGMIDAKYRSRPEVTKYVKNVTDDRSLTVAEKEKKIRELEERIQKIAAENEQFRGEVERLKEAARKAGFCYDARDDAGAARSYAEAVQPNKPCVRDFAASIAAPQPGSYDDAERGIPSATGIRQFCAVHTYLAGAWKYVDDPTVAVGGFISPPDRTIVLGFAGDCDDFAVLVASCGSAVGGITRIMHGSCSGGAHAWAEVLVGDSAAWRAAVTQVRAYFNAPGRDVRGLQDGSGRYWLCLDWRLGSYSCAEGAVEVAYSQQ